MKMVMKDISKIIRERRSVRAFDGRELNEKDKEALCSLMEKTENPYGITVEFRFMSAKEHGLTCPVVSGTDLYVGGKIKDVPEASVAFGYSFEAFVLYAQSLGLGTVWLGGTMNRAAFEKAMELSGDEMMPCACAIGYPAKKMSVREAMMRKAIKADDRLPFEELFFCDSLDTPLTKDKADRLAEVLEMVRLAPSAVNKQPWRVVAADNTAHFYLKRSKGYAHKGKLDMQMIDMGIALCHFAFAAEEYGLGVEFVRDDPEFSLDFELEYIASYRIK